MFEWLSSVLMVMSKYFNVASMALNNLTSPSLGLPFVALILDTVAVLNKPSAFMPRAMYKLSPLLEMYFTLLFPLLICIYSLGPSINFISLVKCYLILPDISLSYFDTFLYSSFLGFTTTIISCVTLSPLLDSKLCESHDSVLVTLASRGLAHRKRMQ